MFVAAAIGALALAPLGVWGELRSPVVRSPYPTCHSDNYVGKNSTQTAFDHSLNHPIAAL
jgi:hypothetical protein